MKPLPLIACLLCLAPGRRHEGKTLLDLAHSRVAPASDAVANFDSPHRRRSNKMKTQKHHDEAERLAMDFAITALNAMNFDTSLVSVNTEDVPRMAKDICADGKLANLLAAQEERDQLRAENDALREVARAAKCTLDHPNQSHVSTGLVDKMKKFTEKGITL